MNERQFSSGPTTSPMGHERSNALRMHYGVDLIGARRDTVEKTRRLFAADYHERPLDYESMEPVLKQVEQAMLELLEHETQWNDVVIDSYPLLKRLYMDWDEDHRIFLHEIDAMIPGKKPILHYHQWQSIVRINRGKYKQAIAYGDPKGKVPPICSVIDMPEGSTYEMCDPRLWHAIDTSQGSVKTTMVVKKKSWRTPPPATKHTTSMRYPKMTADERGRLISDFSSIYRAES